MLPSTSTTTASTVRHDAKFIGPSTSPSTYTVPTDSKLLSALSTFEITIPPFRTFQFPSSGGSGGNDNTITIVESTWTFKVSIWQGWGYDKSCRWTTSTSLDTETTLSPFSIVILWPLRSARTTD